MTIQDSCPACATKLETLCTLVGLEENQKVRIGFCPHCGYCGYIDRPTKSWIVKYYSSEWDDAAHINLKATDISCFLNLRDSRRHSVDLVEQLNLSKDSRICEIGTGYGGVLRYLESQGYKNLLGVENSFHRAQLVTQTYGYPVFKGNFEGSEVQSQLAESKPINLFFSNHVFEHVFHPHEFIEAASKLQGEGDHLVLSMPNAEGEHTSLILFYLPHIHSFTKESLEILLNRYGYEVVADNSPDIGNMVITARKVANPKPIFKLRSDYRAMLTAKVKKGLALHGLQGEMDHHYYWEEGWGTFDTSHMTPLRRAGYVEAIRWYSTKAFKRVRQWAGMAFPFLRRFKKGKAMGIKVVEKIAGGNNVERGYSMIVSPISNRVSSAQESIFEVQFPNAINFLIK